MDAEPGREGQVNQVYEDEDINSMHAIFEALESHTYIYNIYVCLYIIQKWGDGHWTIPHPNIEGDESPSLLD